MSKRGVYVIVGLLASAAFCCSLALGNLFFENLSLNNDEAVYVLEAQMFGQGDVTLSDSAHGDAFRPWMSGRVGGDRLVLVQQPTLPALMALSEALFGTMRIALAAIAAAAVVAMYALTNALLRDLRIAVVASACFVLSPLVMVQSAMFVSYVLAVSLTAASLALLTRGLDRQTQGQRFRPWLIGAGLFEGLLLCTRPLEGIIFAVVIFAWTLLRSVNVRIAIRAMMWVYVASTPLLIVALAYNSFTTGDPFTFALWTIGGDDSFGFGMRSIAEHSQFIHVGPWEAWLALRVNLRAFPHWIVGGVVSVPLAVWGASRLWTISRSVFWLVIVQLCLTPFAYFFYYGNYLIIGGRNFYGPHYYLSLLLPTMVLLAVALALRTVEHGDTGVIRRRRLDPLDRLPRRPVADDEQLPVLTGLPLQRIDSEREEHRRACDGDEDSKRDAHDAVSPSIRASRSTTIKPSRTVLYGGGPPYR